jgi:methyl-accepting chemotaxis protein
MTLRTRLLIGYGYLVLLLVVTAVSAAIGFFGLSKGIDRILEENFDSVESSTRMLEALERQDSATFKHLLGDSSRDRLDEVDATFENSLAAARANITLEREAELIDQIERDYEAYRVAREELIARGPARPLVQYNEEVFPHFNRVKEDVMTLLDVNHDAMIAADRAAQASAMRSGVWLGVLVTIGLLSFVLLTRALQKHLLSRLAEFEEVTEAIASGDEFRRLPVERSDELGTIARHFNTSIDRIDEVRSEARGRLSEYKGLVVGLLAEVPEEAVLLALDGSVIASMLSEAHDTLLMRHRDEIADESKEHFETSDSDFFEYDLGEATCQFELVKSKSRRPVGWLGRVLDADEEGEGAEQNADSPDEDTPDEDARASGADSEA